MNLLDQRIADQQEITMPAVRIPNFVHRHRDRPQIMADPIQIKQAHTVAKPRICFLHSQYVRPDFGNHSRSSRQITASVGADTFMDVIGCHI